MRSSITGREKIVELLTAKGVKKKSAEFKTNARGWMNENLNISRFRNGALIPEAKTIEEWRTFGEKGLPAWCHINNDPSSGVE